MPLLRIIYDFTRLSDSKLLERSNFIHMSVSTRTAVFSTPLPTMVVFKGACDEFQSALNASLTGDRILVAQKNIFKANLIELLYKLGYYVLFTASGDRFIALESAYTIAGLPVAVVISKPAALKVENSSQPGELLVSVKKVPGAVAYMHQYSTDPLLAEASWMSMTCSSSKCTISNLVIGTRYFIRVGAIGTKDQVVYSDVVSKMVA
jgi:hypothetical protein